MWKIRVCNVNLFSDQLSKSHVLHCNGFALLCLCCWQWYHWGLAKPGLTMLDSLSLCCTDSDTDPSAAKHCLEQNVHYLPPVDCPRSMTVATIFYILSLQCPDPDSDSPSTFFKSNSFHSESPFPLQLLPYKRCCHAPGRPGRPKQTQVSTNNVAPDICWIRKIITNIFNPDDYFSATFLTLGIVWKIYFLLNGKICHKSNLFVEQHLKFCNFLLFLVVLKERLINPKLRIQN